MIIECPEPGIYPQVPHAVYHAWDACSNSRLGWLERSPAHALAAIRGETKETPALLFGRAAHAAVLEPELFSVAYRAGTQCEGVTAKGARCSNAGRLPLVSGGCACETHKGGAEIATGIDVISATDHAKCLRLQEVVEAKTKASRLIKTPGEFELSIVWDDPATGIRCKGRLDHYGPELDGGVTVDLKTCEDASRAVFERKLFRYGYNRQAAMYEDGCQVLGLPCRHFVILAVEKEEPFEIAPYRLTSAAIDAGRDILRPLMGLYAECVLNEEWPGYPDRVEDITLPDWAWRATDDKVKELTGSW